MDETLKLQAKWVDVIKYHWLQEYKKLEQEMDVLKWRIIKMESELKRWNDPEDLGRVKLTEEGDASRLEENIKRDKSFLREKELAIESMMSMIERFKGLDSQILKMKYMDGMTLKDISLEIGLQLFLYHDKALATNAGNKSS